ncbi:hypothetical protein F9230_07045 [Acinetobacter johnsonii]|uniref:hypothetical protein n=1 Tax=Acinetobacter johnsonii TaxID=40214 RepID=UPI001F25E93C|nr:hypothetical protein [Acinetobacter johnsonii]UJA04121.1 hypothetical protein F9230_07045 [Acinetobacter johnsonii]
MIVLMVTLLILANTEKAATQKAFDDLKSSNFVAVTLKNSKENTSYKNILCGSTLCAIMNNDKKVTLEETKNLVFTPKEQPKDKKAP